MFGRSFKNLLNRADEFFSCLFLAGMCIIIAMQVFNRYVLGNSLDWSEELGRYLFIWAVYIGCSYAMKEDRHLEVTVIRHFFGSKLERISTIIAYTLSIVFNIICIVFGIKMFIFLINTGQNSPAMEIKMYWVYLSIPLGMGLMAFRTLERVIKLFSKRNSNLNKEANRSASEGV